MIRAAVIGLGQAGFRFQLDPLRSGIWSHSAAYEAAPEVLLAAAVDVDPVKQNDFRRQYPKVPTYDSVTDLLMHQSVDLASVCVPTAHHLSLVEDLAGRVRGIFCEKPMGMSLEQAERIVSICHQTGTLLAVNFIRRWEKPYVAAKQLIDSGELGSLRTVTGRYPGELVNIGTHLIDIMCFLGGPVQTVAGIVEHRDGEREAAGSALMTFFGGATGCITTHCIRKNGLFEVDIIGETGRLQLLDNGRRTNFFIYTPSTHYSGYNELTPAHLTKKQAGLTDDRMLAAVRDVAACLADSSRLPNCSGPDALHAQAVVDAIVRSHRDGAFVTL